MPSPTVAEPQLGLDTGAAPQRPLKVKSRLISTVVLVRLLPLLGRLQRGVPCVLSEKSGHRPVKRTNTAR